MIQIQENKYNLLTERVEWVDIAKGLAMIFVIVVHCGAHLPLTTILSSFHMPLFFIIAGFFLFSKKQIFKPFVKSKFKTLLIPYLIFGFLLATYSTCADIVAHRDITPGFRHIGLLTNTRSAPFFGSLWFLISLFTCEIILYFLNRKTKNGALAITGCILAFCVGGGWLSYSKKGLPLCFDLTLLCMIFCQIGYYIYPYIYSLKKPIYIIDLLFVFSISVIWNYNVMGNSVDLFSNRIGNSFLFFCSALSGSLLVILISMQIGHSSILKYIGKNSLLYYCLQFLLLMAVTKSLSLISLKVPFIKHTIPYVSSIIIIAILVPIINYINKKHQWIIGRKSNKI